MALALAGFIPGLGDAGKHADKLDEVTEVLQGVARGLDDLPTGLLDELTSLLSRSPELIEAVGKNPEIAEALLKNPEWIKSLAENPGLMEAVVKNPEQMVHHFATNKSSKWTNQMDEIARKYGLDLDDPGNKESILHG